MKKLLIGTALLVTALPFTLDGVTPTVSKARAEIGRPLTPGSVAGVHRRAMRRPYGVGANLGAAAYGAGYYGAGYGYGYGAPLYSYAGAAPGIGGYGLGGYGCYPTFDYSKAGTNFARVLAMFLGPALATSDWRSLMNWSS